MSVSIVSPNNGSEFQVGNIIQFQGRADGGVETISLDTPFAGKEFHLNTVPVNEDGSWSVNCSFNTGGDRIVIAKGLDDAEKEIANTKLQITLIDYKDLVNIPSGINIGLSSAKTATMLDLLGKPGSLTKDCSSVTNPDVKRFIVTKNVGPFTVTGLKPAIDVLERIFAKVKQEQPDLYQQLGTAGMLCCRKVRGGTNFSNHSWGTAIDIKISSDLDEVGDDKAQLGLVKLAPYFNAEKFFWGAGFNSRGREDSMHFEVSEELIKEWENNGVLS
jgi:hypothetical protein